MGRNPDLLKGVFHVVGDCVKNTFLVVDESACLRQIVKMALNGEGSSVEAAALDHGKAEDMLEQFHSLDFSASQAPH